MKDFFLEAFLYPFLAILFCLAFGVPFVYTGFQTVEVRGSKDDQGIVTIDFDRSHFWGLYRVKEHIEGVENASLKTSLTRTSGIRRTRQTLVSGVFLETEAGAVRLLAGSSNVDDDLKREAVRSINDFIAAPERTSYSNTIRLANVFGWFGLPFLAIGVLGLVGWPGSIIRRLKD